MQVKGTSIKTTKEFVKTNFPKQFDKWIGSLPAKSKELYLVNTEFSSWFPLKEATLHPMDKVIEMFFNNDIKAGADALGSFSAEYALRGVYKVFLLVASPQYLMKRATKIMTTFYQPCKIDVLENGNKSIILIISEFEQMNEAMEYRFGGWCQKAFELTNCKNVKYTIQKALTKNDPVTEIVFSWD